MENTTQNALPNTVAGSIPVVDISENIKNEKFHNTLKEQFGDKASPFIKWAKNTQLDDKITSTKLEKLVLLYEGAVEFDLVAKAVALDPEVKKEMADVFSGKEIKETKETIPTDKLPTVEMPASIKNKDFHEFLKEQFGEKALPFIDWANRTKLHDKITPRKLETLVLLYEGDIEFKLVENAVVLDSEVKKEIFNIFEDKNMNTLVSNIKTSVDIAEGIKNGDFHLVLKEQFGDNAKPFIDWAKNTKLEDKITPIKLEKLVLLYEDGVDFNLAIKAVPLDTEVRNEIFNIFEDQKINAQLLARKPRM